MNRKTFIRQCTFITAGIALPACIVTQSRQGLIKNGVLYLVRSNLPMDKLPATAIIHQPELAFPILLYQTEPEKILAIWMKCTHQGVELQLYGDKLVCQAHGSEFQRNGSVLAGPASEALRKLQTAIDATYIKIYLQ